jgi:hypothetical protein
MKEVSTVIAGVAMLILALAAIAMVALAPAVKLPESNEETPAGSPDGAFSGQA